MSAWKPFVMGLSGIFVGIVLLVSIVWAADVLTVDKDGTIRLRVSDTGKVTLNTNEPAQGDMRFTPRAADPTAPLEGDLWYNATAATLKAKAGSDTANIPGKFTRYITTKTDANFDTTSTAWVNVTGLSVTFTTDYPNQVVQISATLRGSADTANTGNRIDFALDGTRLSGATWGLISSTSAVANATVNLSTSYLYMVPSAGSHTVTVQTYADSGVTNTIKAPGAPAILQVLKFY